MTAPLVARKEGRPATGQPLRADQVARYLMKMIIASEHCCSCCPSRLITELKLSLSFRLEDQVGYLTAVHIRPDMVNLSSCVTCGATSIWCNCSVTKPNSSLTHLLELVHAVGSDDGLLLARHACSCSLRTSAGSRFANCSPTLRPAVRQARGQAPLVTQSAELLCTYSPHRSSPPRHSCCQQSLRSGADLGARRSQLI